VREIRSPGSVRGAVRKGRPYRDVQVSVFGCVTRRLPMTSRLSVGRRRMHPAKEVDRPIHSHLLDALAVAFTGLKTAQVESQTS
jgi:hypothetical protein